MEIHFLKNEKKRWCFVRYICNISINVMFKLHLQPISTLRFSVFIRGDLIWQHYYLYTLKYLHHFNKWRHPSSVQGPVLRHQIIPDKDNRPQCWNVGSWIQFDQALHSFKPNQSSKWNMFITPWFSVYKLTSYTQTMMFVIPKSNHKFMV